MLNEDPLKKVLYIDLSKKNYWIKERTDLFEKYIGGTGVAVQLLKEECPRGCDPLNGTNVIVFAVGPLTSLFPLASKTVAVFKSPHTGNLGESHCGGRSAIALRMAGYGALVIRGTSSTPIYIAVHGDKVLFRDASTLWGMGSSYSRQKNNYGRTMINRILIAPIGLKASYTNLHTKRKLPSISYPTESL